MTVRSDSHSSGLEQAVGHPLGLDEQHLVERVAAGRLEIGRLIDPGVSVPHPAEPLDDPLHLFARDVGRPLEIHVLDPVRRAGEPGPSSREPTPYQHHTDTSGAVCTS